MKTSIFTAWLGALLGGALAGAAEIRIGMVGVDTSHAVRFTMIFNDPAHKDHVPGARVVGAFKASSLDIETSRTLVDGYAEELRTKFGVKFYDSIAELGRNVDAIMIESVDGRPHLAQVQAAVLAGKPIYVDKPMAASLKEGLEIFALARKHQVPIFSSSSLRYVPETQAVRHGSIGRVLRAEAGSPASLEPHHMDLFWYGIHGVETLITVMGPGLARVRRVGSEPGAIVTEGIWRDGRTGVFREMKGYGGQAVGEKGEASLRQGSPGYPGQAMLAAAVKFFRDGVPPVPEQETIEILAFMEADYLSKQRGGVPVTVAEVMQRAGR